MGRRAGDRCRVRAPVEIVDRSDRSSESIQVQLAPQFGFCIDLPILILFGRKACIV